MPCQKSITDILDTKSFDHNIIYVLFVKLFTWVDYYIINFH